MYGYTHYTERCELSIIVLLLITDCGGEGEGEEEGRVAEDIGEFVSP